MYQMIEEEKEREKEQQAQTKGIRLIGIWIYRFFNGGMK